MIRPLNTLFITLFNYFLIAASCWAYTALVEWSPNSEPDLTEYTVHYGSHSGVYEKSVNVGKANAYAINGLKKNETYYIAITATNSAGLESDFSVEVTLNYWEVEAFISRFYQYCLGRNPDQDGLDGWVASLLEGVNTGADVASGFVFSQEFTAKKTSNAEYITILYKAFFDRAPDQTGWNGWIAALENGTTREEVLSGFIFAIEFGELCDKFNILAFKGYFPRSLRMPVEAFVRRFYELCLDRNSDPAGLEKWTKNLLSHLQTGADVARGFIFSQEFIARNTSNKDFLTILYAAFFDRNPDQAGWNAWLVQLNNGKNRSDVLDGFLQSQEFIELCQYYGIIAYE